MMDIVGVALIRSLSRTDATPLTHSHAHRVALTDASPDNSCLYVLPRWADPGYSTGDLDSIDPLQRALPSKENFQSIRALPAPAGSCYVFTHRIIHWGSSGRQGYHTPRIALSFACSVEDFEPAYFDRQHLPFPAMALRLALACSQMLVYHERFSFTPKQLSMFHQVFRAQSHLLHDSFRTKVVKEFVAAVKEASMPNLATPVTAASSSSAPSKVSSSRNRGNVDEDDNDDAADVDDDDDDDSVVDEALDAMLDAVHAGCDEFDDDFEDVDEQGLFGDMAAADSDEDDDDDEDDEEDEEQARKWMEQLHSAKAKRSAAEADDASERDGTSPDAKRRRTR